MPSSKATVRVTILNSLGLHARPAMSFVDTANGFKSDILVCKGAQKVDGKSIMQMMMLGATQGPDAVEALTALDELVTRKFDEE